MSRGARFVYRENNNTFAQDIEPEYVAFNADETIAYIGLQVIRDLLFNLKVVVGGRGGLVLCLKTICQHIMEKDFCL